MTCHGGRAHPRRDTGGIVVGWLTKVTVVLGLLGLCLFDAISVGSARMSVADDATTAASAAADAWKATHQLQRAYDAAAQSLADTPDDEVLTKTFTIDADGTVHLQVRRTALTVVLSHIGLKKWAVVVESGTAHPVG